MSDTRIRVTATVDAPTAVVFDYLASPHRHKEFDASGMVGTDEFDEPITKTGQVFRMNMERGPADARIEYQVDNTVTKFKANRKVAWAVGEVDGDPYGWTWRYDLSPKGKNEQKTLVTLTYDWADATDHTVKTMHLPLFSEADLEASLKLLGKVVKHR
ncbi:MAG: polyketide cyclase [Nocardioidaceae bacterium]|nr:polyketide cyclase [Nocardioidaceae bacterium]